MDHLILPENPTHGIVEVPVFTTTGYDGGDFETYPERQGWAKQPVAVWRQIFKEPPLEFKAFLQRWLYFGTLEMVLQDRVNVSDFTRPSRQNSPYPALTTKELPRLVQLSIDRTWRTGSLGLGKSLVQMSFVLKARLGLRLHSTGLEYHERTEIDALRHQEDLIKYIFEERPASALDPLVIMSMDLLWDFLMLRFIGPAAIPGHHTTDTDLGKALGSDRPWNSHQWSCLREDGWCPSDLIALTSEFGVSGLLFLHNLVRPNPTQHHQVINIRRPPLGTTSLGSGNQSMSQVPYMQPSALCKPYGCSSKHLLNDTYQTRHVSDCPGCHDMVADEDELCAILLRGKIPLILSTDPGDDSTSITLIESDGGDDVAYVAISHVWSDGLGNLERNAIPRCQLLRLSALVRNLPERGPASNTVLFWLDTICVPPDAAKHEEAQIRAIQLMRRTYEEAVAVLTLDSWLLSHSCARSSDVESMMRIFSCAWNRRLWTYQEGALAKAIYFQFQDLAFDLDAAMKVLSTTKDLVLDLTLSQSLHERYDSLRGFKISEGRLEKKLGAVASAVRFRSTSVASDEALCLAALLDLDMRRVLESAPATRMQTFWQLLPRVPASILWYTGETIDVDGLRWAPQTLLLSKGNFQVGSERYKGVYLTQSNSALVTPRGLLFQGSGLIFKTRGVPIGEDFFLFHRETGQGYQMICQFRPSKTTSAYQDCQDDGGRTDNKLSTNPAVCHGIDKVAFVCTDTTDSMDSGLVQRGAVMTQNASGALVAITEEVEDGTGTVFYAKKLGIMVRLEPDPTIQRQAVQRLEMSRDALQRGAVVCDPKSGVLSMASATAAAPTQKWCVD